MKAAVAVARWLAEKQFERCYELAGGMITHLLDAMLEVGKTSIVSMHHEQAAGFAAEGYMRSIRGQKFALAMGTSGPGATNLLTPIGSCWFDSVPCLFITGQVNTNELKGQLPIRQQGFQELDIVTVAKSITKYAVRIEAAAALLPELHKAFSIAMSGRRGPVLIDIPNNVQREEIPDVVVNDWLQRPMVSEAVPVVSEDRLQHLRKLCENAQRPLICFGGGAKVTSRFENWRDQLERAGIPYVSTLLGQERALASRCYFGMIGSYGCRTANWAIQNCDLLIVIGARLDVRQTGANTADFARSARVVQVDIDEGQLNNRIKVHLSIISDAARFFDAFPVGAAGFQHQSGEWLSRLEKHRSRFDKDEYVDQKVSPYHVMQQVMAAVGDRKVHFVCDVGNHQMWAAHTLKLKSGQTIHHCGGMGAMGFSLPAAIGVAEATGESVIVVAGDGGLQLNIQELDTLNRLRLPVTVIVLNNESLGMVKNFQDMYFEGRDQSTRRGYSFPNFFEVAKAFGIKAHKIEPGQPISPVIADSLQASLPSLIEIRMPGATECRPRLAFGSRLDEQFPAENAD